MSIVSYTQSRRLVDAFFAKRLLNGLKNHYPDFDHWYTNQCMPGIVAGDDVMLLAHDRGELVGVALGRPAKGPGLSAKLRCIRVLGSHQNLGVGLHLIDRTLKALGDEKPHCTVSEEMIHLYSRAFVNRYGFDLNAVEKGLYRPGKLEYVFNGQRGSGLEPSSAL